MSLFVSIKKKLGSFHLDVSFEADGGILGILGSSGCGKSMTLKCIAGIETPDEGVIRLDGRVLFDSKQRINLPPQKRKVGYLFQNYALFPNMTVRQNIAAGVSKDKKDRDSFLEGKIRSLYLEGMENKYPHQLSGGQQQRVALARILASEPELILLDEPFSALDSYLRWQLEQELVNTLEGFSGGALFVSHSRDEVYRICQKVCVINEGRSEAVLPVRTLFEDPSTLSAALLSGCKNYTRIHPLSENAVFAEDWGVPLTVARNADPSFVYAGVRAHFIRLVPEPGPDTFPCVVTRVVQDVFSTIVMLRPCSAPEEGPTSSYSAIRAELSKEAWAELCPSGKEPAVLSVQIAPRDILLLKA